MHSKKRLCVRQSGEHDRWLMDLRYTLELNQFLFAYNALPVTGSEEEF